MPSRSWLYVPGNRPDRFVKAVRAGADVVVIDLEDAVPNDQKISARGEIQRWLSTTDHAIYVRINADRTPWFDEDIVAFASDERITGFVIPKVESGETICRAVGNAHPTLRIVPIIETARAFVSLNEIARAPRVERLMLGTIDFRLDLGIEGEGDELLYFRSKLVLASRIAGIAPSDRWGRDDDRRRKYVGSRRPTRTRPGIPRKSLHTPSADPGRAYGIRLFRHGNGIGAPCREGRAGERWRSSLG